MSEIKKLESKEIYKNRWMRLREDTILRDSGEQGIFSVVEKDDFAVIIPIEDRQIYVVRQYRYPISEVTIELPQGSWEGELGADPLEVAKGELKEETGLTAETMIYVGYQTLACGYSNQGYNIYLAKDLTSGPTSLDKEEHGLTAEKMSLEAFEKCLFEGKIKDATTTAAYLLAKHKKLIPVK